MRTTTRHAFRQLCNLQLINRKLQQQRFKRFALGMVFLFRQRAERPPNQLLKQPNNQQKLYSNKGGLVYPKKASRRSIKIATRNLRGGWAAAGNKQRSPLKKPREASESHPTFPEIQEIVLDLGFGNVVSAHSCLASGLLHSPPPDSTGCLTGSDVCWRSDRPDQKQQEDGEFTKNSGRGAYFASQTNNVAVERTT